MLEDFDFSGLNIEANEPANINIIPIKRSAIPIDINLFVSIL